MNYNRNCSMIQPYAGPSPGSCNHPTPPSPGYVYPPPQIQWSGDRDADALRKAMKGFGTDERVLISVLANRDPLQVHVICQSFFCRLSRDLEEDIKSETSGWFREGLFALLRGPLISDVYLLRSAFNGFGAKEKILNDVLLGRSNADLRAIKDLYKKTWHIRLESEIDIDLCKNTKRHFLLVLVANRNEDSAPIISEQIAQDVMEIYHATEAKIKTDELLVSTILSQRSDAQIRSITSLYLQSFGQSLETVIKTKFSGHLESALLHQLYTAVDKPKRDATLLEATMSGTCTKDQLLVHRIVRIHWDRFHLQRVQREYESRFRKKLSYRVSQKTSGNYKRLMIACLGDK